MLATQQDKGMEPLSSSMKIRLCPRRVWVGNQAEFPGPWLSCMETEMPQQVKNWLSHLKDGKEVGGESKREKELLPLNN